MAAAVESSFDVAFWFMDRAIGDNEYLQPQKLHRLMFLAQAYYGVAYNGRLLMPAMFIADEFGPIEPNVFRACAIQRPAVDTVPMDAHVVQFLDSIWRRFGAHSAEALNRQVCGHAPYGEALAHGLKSEIPLRAMVDFYGKKSNNAADVAPVVGAPPVQQVLRPKLMRSQTGKPVAVQKWTPKTVK